ncbi:uncharacterized protein BXZ73DRAFT_106329 [Epithele typhae]|uniref:uncharacterized protein n=1 Tax=Epithele typhae TaxID=378194 RepID=UPI002007A935|nr:uncharacterized protein BXZ73DRAFT_106329 [Epithele typhae]KAH9915018.1 hypothetical protein BXZ73DRAFT_106329 [Epithele typhae]
MNSFLGAFITQSFGDVAFHDDDGFSRAVQVLTRAQRGTQRGRQTFSTPIIRLTIEDTKAPDGRLHSFRVKIMWICPLGRDAMDADQQEIGFEDLDFVV